MQQKYKVGRWTQEQHSKFIQGIKLFGRNWKKIQEYVVTRTGYQIRSHAQKFFNRTKILQNIDSYKQEDSTLVPQWDNQFTNYSYYLQCMYATLDNHKNIKPDQIVYKLVDRKELKQINLNQKSQTTEIGFRPYKSQKKYLFDKQNEFITRSQL